MTFIDRGTRREDLEYRARKVRQSIDVCRRIGDIAGVSDLNRTLSAICGEAERPSPAPEPEADLQLEPLPADLEAVPVPYPTAKEQPMGIRNSAPETAADPVPPGGWFYDKPLPYSLTPLAEATLAFDDPEAEPDTW